MRCCVTSRLPLLLSKKKMMTSPSIHRATPHQSREYVQSAICSTPCRSREEKNGGKGAGEEHYANNDDTNESFLSPTATRTLPHAQLAFAFSFALPPSRHHWDRALHLPFIPRAFQLLHAVEPKGRLSLFLSPSHTCKKGGERKRGGQPVRHPCLLFIPPCETATPFHSCLTPSYKMMMMMALFFFGLFFRLRPPKLV